jgi:dihydrodipicolinate synthase/N-acetylneuraminate lyase
MELKGVFPAIATPLRGDEQVDEKGLRRLVGYLLDAKVQGLLVNGSMGGFAVLTDEEQLRAVSITVSEVGGAVPVLAGLGETGTRRALIKAERMAQTGANLLAVLPPFYMRPTQDQVFSYYSDIAMASEIPLLVYDNPVHTKCYIEPETVVRLCKAHNNIIGIKESNSDCENLQELIHLTKTFPNFSVLTASETLMLLGLQVGCTGAIGGLYNVCPHLAVETYQAFMQGDTLQAVELQRAMIDIAAIFRYGSIWGGFDEAMRYLKICIRTSGKPYASSLPPQEALKVRQILDKHLSPYVAARLASSTAL